MKEAIEALDTLIEKAERLEKILKSSLDLQNELLRMIDRTSKDAVEEFLDALP